MSRQTLQAAAAVLGAVVAAFVFYGVVLDVSREGELHWEPVVGGVLTGAAVLVVWTCVRQRIEAAVALAATAALVVLGTQATVVPAQGVAQAPTTWAVLLALAVRVAAPGSRHTTENRAQRVAG